MFVFDIFLFDPLGDQLAKQSKYSETPFLFPGLYVCVSKQHEEMSPKNLANPQEFVPCENLHHAKICTMQKLSFH